MLFCNLNGVGNRCNMAAEQAQSCAWGNVIALRSVEIKNEIDGLA